LVISPLPQVIVCPLCASRPPPSHQWRRRLLLDQGPVKLPKMSLIEKPADHVRRDQLGARLVKLMSGHELEVSIGAGQRSFEASMEKAAGLDDNHAGSASVKMAAVRASLPCGKYWSRTIYVQFGEKPRRD
jgi:hypothetical protein